MVAVVCCSNLGCPAGAFDALNHKLIPPHCTMAEIEARLRRNPADVSALQDRGQTYLTAGECELAIADYNTILKMYPHNASAFLGRSRAYAMLDKFEPALRDINASIKADDRKILADAVLHKISILGSLKRENECPPLWETLLVSKGLGVGPNDRIKLRVQRAAYYLRSKQPAKALDDLKICQAAKPSDLNIYLSLGLAYRDLKQPEQELAAYTSGIKLDTGSRGISAHRELCGLYQERAAMYKKMGKLALADADLKKLKSHQGVLYSDIYDSEK